MNTVLSLFLFAAAIAWFEFRLKRISQEGDKDQKGAFDFFATKEELKKAVKSLTEKAVADKQALDERITSVEEKAFFAQKAEEKAAEEPEAVVDVAVLGEDKAEESKDETPAEEVKEEKKEEAKQEDGNKKLTLAEQLDPKRKITVKAEWDGEQLYFGDTATLRATLSGYDNAVYTIRWQTSKDGNKWEDIKGAEGAELKVTVTEDNYMNYWRALVVVTAVKAE